MFCRRELIELALGMLAMQLKMDNFTKIIIVLGLCLILGAGSISLSAADNPAQAAARAALLQKLNEPDGPHTRSLPATNPPSEAVVEQPAKPAKDTTETVPEKAEASPIASLATTPEAAPAAIAPAPAPVAPAVVSPAAVVSPVPVAPKVARPGAVAPATAAPAISPVTLLLVLIGLLLIALVVMVILLLKLRALKLMLLKNPTVMARLAEASRRRTSKRDSTGAHAPAQR